ncbi:hypothetical protein [Spartinivicinus poritis]|uniref:Uncharacterized protein n=1 Tax=Spartinivicinus poritis TaxID=2994640 RepID=A0ABT5U3H5_9GAMM|nr:hypothetical protein [Spartinivicinus sp. A2-2]MDE1460911.1 hypothetical protein [Spartinivicinus sp. A2-2]
MSTSTKELPLIIKAPIYLAGIVFGIFITKSILNNDPKPDDQVKLTTNSDVVTNIRVSKGELKSMLEKYYMNYGEYPVSLAHMVPSIYRHLPISMCGKAYSYLRASTGNSYSLVAEGC